MKILFFFNTWNGKCKREKERISYLSKFYNISIELIDIDLDKETCTKYFIKGSPSAVLFYNNEQVGRIIGGGPISFYTEILDKYECRNSKKND